MKDFLVISRLLRLQLCTALLACSQRLQPRLVLLVVLAQVGLLDKETDCESQRSKTSVHYEHGLQALPVGCLGDSSFATRESPHESNAARRVGARQLCGEFGTEFALEHTPFVVHFVVEDDAADDDGDGGAELADEGEGGGGRTNVARLDVGLKGNEGSLEVGTDADTSDDLEDDDLGPVGLWLKVDEKTETDNGDHHGGDNDKLVQASLFDVYATCGRDEGESQNVGQQIDTRQQRRRSKNTLVV